MGNKILFGVIAFLMLAIIGIGFLILSTPQTTSPVQTGSSSPVAPTTITQPVPAPAAGTYTMAQVASHNSSASCYTAVSGSVYDLTPFIDQHPGGAQAILSLCGQDGTAAFMGQHGGQRRPVSELASFKIGMLAQ